MDFDHAPFPRIKQYRQNAKLSISFLSVLSYIIKSISFSSHSPFVLCYNVLCDFLSPLRFGRYGADVYWSERKCP